MLLSPKMADHYAQMAKEGKADRMIGDKIYIFDCPGQPSREIVLVTLNPPSGHIGKKNK